MNNTPDDDDRPAPRTALASVLRAQAAALTTQAQTLLTLADEAERNSSSDSPDELLVCGDPTMELAGIGRDGLKNAGDRGEITLVRGARGQLLVRRSELERWLASRPYRPRKVAATAADPIAAWEAEAEKLCGGGE